MANVDLAQVFLFKVVCVLSCLGEFPMGRMGPAGFPRTLRSTPWNKDLQLKWALPVIQNTAYTYQHGFHKPVFAAVPEREG